MSNLTVDVWQTLDGTLSSGGLDATDNYATTGQWTITDASAKLDINAGAEQQLLGLIGSARDNAGVSGLRYHSNAAGVAGYVSFALPASTNKVSFGCWFKTDTGLQGTFNEHDILCCHGSQGNKDLFVKLTDGNGGTNNEQIQLFNPIDNYTRDNLVQITLGTWYWIMVRMELNVQKGMLCRVYDTTGKQVGDELYRSTDTDNSTFHISTIEVGSFVGGPVYSPDGFVYFDDLVIDFTNAAWPLGPGKSRFILGNR